MATARDTTARRKRSVTRPCAQAELQKARRVAGAPVQVRNPLAAGVQRENSAFLSSDLPVAGFAVIEAADLSEAIKIVSLTPCAVAHGVVEVWPLSY